MPIGILPETTETFFAAAHGRHANPMRRRG